MNGHHILRREYRKSRVFTLRIGIDVTLRMAGY
jgi:hypothetical protein